MRGCTDDTVRQSICEVFLEKAYGIAVPPACSLPPQGSLKPCRQDADPHTET